MSVMDVLPGPHGPIGHPGPHTEDRTDPIEATFPRAWVQTCIVHLIRASLRYVNYRDKKKVAQLERALGRKTYELELAGNALRAWEWGLSDLLCVVRGDRSARGGREGHP